MRTALYIHADEDMDLGDVVNIARSEGEKALNTDGNIQVLRSFRFESDFVVVVEEEKSYNASAVEAKGEKKSVKT